MEERDGKTVTGVGSEIETEVLRRVAEAAPDCIDFLRDLVTIPSPSGAERLACEHVAREMERLGYDEVQVDGMGNVLGRIGSGSRVLAFDAHVDTVGISNPKQWKVDPFGGSISGGVLYGRGASDQKGGLAAIVHGVAMTRQVGLPEDLTVWVTATVNGEDCVGLAWQYIVNEVGLKPEAVVIAMPSHLGVCFGQRGRMEVQLTTHGIGAHGSQPERGSNAIYAMAPIVQGIERLHGRLVTSHPRLGKGSVAVTGITSQSASLTAIPDECTIYVDRRITIGESREVALEELEGLPAVQAVDAEIEVLHYDKPSWKGLKYPTPKCFPAWETPEDSPAVRAALATAGSVLGRTPRIHRSNFSSNACATAGMFGIPTVGFGPADEVHSHSVNDQIPLVQLQPAMAFYALFPSFYLRESSAS
ncbi:MAG TPA: YgeY family selenium metabolism-linked hydrolase [Acidobacteria bacterium]|nr:YgeY family selenium metabolism-linked hydrolase [Acidobacteriota bacterium]